MFYTGKTVVKTVVKFEMIMKKLFSVLSVTAALFAAALLFTGCEKHAYSYSTNKFRDASSGVVIGSNLKLSVGQAKFIVAAMDNGKGAYLDGEYTATTNDASIVGAQSSSFEGKECIVLTGINTGETNVTLKLMHDGFDLHKTITVTVLQ